MRRCCAPSIAASAWCWWWRKSEADEVLAALVAAGEAPVRIGEIEPGRGVKSQAKGKGEAEAVRYSGKLGFARDATQLRPAMVVSAL